MEKESKTLPAYRRLYEELRGSILAGNYARGSKLPSKRQLAQLGGVSVITAGHALELLCEEGYVRPRERSGYFCVYGERETEPSGEMTETPEAGETTGMPPELIGKAMRQVLNRYPDFTAERSPNMGLPELRREISAYLGRSRGVHAPAERISVGAGAEYLYGRIVEVLGREHVFGVESPSYEKIQLVYRAVGARTVELALGENGIRTEELRTTEADVLHVTPYRSYPSGVTANAAKRREYAAWGSREGRFLVEDDYNSELSAASFPAETVFSLSGCDNVIYVNSFSATVSPAFRIAYAVWPQQLMERVQSRIGFYSCTVPVFEQLVMLRLLAGGAFERNLLKMRRRLRKPQA